ncbi:MAG: hypothetical protein GXP30_01555 [Verrucomicrobia bacterium]|nr:hypothetical protein [Verrucomicrobiota bacterium]
METGDLERKKSSGGGWFKWVATLIMIAVFTIIVFGGRGHPIGPILRTQTKLAVIELEAGLSAYKLDSGAYPINSGNEIEGAFVLYKYLSGDSDGNGKVDPASVGTKIYVEGIDWDTAKGLSQQRVRKIEGRFALIDLYGELIRYRCEDADLKRRTTRNPTYDLWSLGGSDSGSDKIEARSKWITNWE